jgi:stearoyl-CoA desaturase (delta-9 desaturase)
MENRTQRSLWSRLDWPNVLFMTLTPIAALILTPIYLMNHGISWGLVAFFAVCYTMSNMSITCGYHRYFSHRSYDAHPIIEFLYIFIGAGAFQSSILQWCTDHRRHHRSVDTNEDPYSVTKSFWWAHVGWMMVKDDHPDADVYPHDLTKNPLIAFQHKYYALVATFVGFILPGLVGWALGFGFWGGVIIGGALRIVLTQHSTFLINSAAHTFGRQPYTDKNTAKDSLIMAFLTFGEGYHNYHHFFQADYRNGTRWYHWDPTKWWIRSLAFLGLATKLKRTRKEDILKARVTMDEKKLLASGACADRTSQLKSHLLEAQTRLRQLHDDYLRAKSNWAMRGAEKREVMRAEIKKAKVEFRSAYVQWKQFRRNIRRNIRQTTSAA